MKICILGDVHGYWADMNITIARALRKHPDITHIVQVGDFGYGWDGKPFKFSNAYFDNEERALLENIEFLWLDGNHENHDRLDADRGAWQPGWQYMPRGSVLETHGYRMMFFGGATSADKCHRKPHISWWPQEAISYGQVNNTLNTVTGKLDAIFSHEHPEVVPYSDERYPFPIGEGDRKMLEVLRGAYEPRFWFFGHHHKEEKGVTEDGMEWYCCPIIEARIYTIWDGESVTCEWENPRNYVHF